MRAELRVLAGPVADTVARHLVAAGRSLDEDPPGALAHALAARRLASRIAVVREAVGIAAYHADEWHTAIGELRAYHRISGSHRHLAMVADCERALGRPERAIDIYRTAPREELATAETVELVIVAAAARADLGHRDAAVAMLQVPELARDGREPWVARLRYAYADTLLAAGRRAEAREWFARAAEADEDALTDAAERLLELDGVALSDTDQPEEDGDAGEIQDSAPDHGETDHGETDQGETEDGVLGDRAAGGAGTGARTARLVDGYDLVVMDLDGVVYLGDEPVPAAAETVAALRQDGPPLVFVTNNASRDADDVAALLCRLGIPASAQDVLTSAMVAAETLATLLEAGTAVLVVGTDALAGEVCRAGLRPVRRADEAPAAVVQGYGPGVGWADLAEAAVAIQAGARWVVTNTDATLPSPRGPLPGNGSLVAALRTALGRDPDLVVGKPQPALFETAARRTGASRPLVVGDRLDTDIDAARRAGMDSLLVLTGVDSRADAAAREPHRRPTHVGTDLTVLLAPAPPPGR